MESQPQNPEFSTHTENFHPCSNESELKELHKIHFVLMESYLQGLIFNYFSYTTIGWLLYTNEQFAEHSSRLDLC